MNGDASRLLQERVACDCAMDCDLREPWWTGRRISHVAPGRWTGLVAVVRLQLRPDGTVPPLRGLVRNPLKKPSSPGLVGLCGVCNEHIDKKRTLKYTLTSLKKYK